jgi:hypothetical protein
MTGTGRRSLLAGCGPSSPRSGSSGSAGPANGPARTGCWPDRAYTSKGNRAHLRLRGIKACIPSKADQDAPPKGERAQGRPSTRLRPARLRLRHAVERGTNQLKQHRAMAARYDKLAVRSHRPRLRTPPRPRRRDRPVGHDQTSRPTDSHQPATLIQRAGPVSRRGLSALERAFSGVTDGIRTRDPRDHNPVLYQLSYSHHVDRARTCRCGAPTNDSHTLARSVDRVSEEELRASRRWPSRPPRPGPEGVRRSCGGSTQARGCSP